MMTIIDEMKDSGHLYEMPYKKNGGFIIREVLFAGWEYSRMSKIRYCNPYNGWTQVVLF